MNTHYLTTSRTNPQFYIFSQLFGDDLDWSNQCDWEGIQNVAWQEFWQREGHELLEQKWHKRFPEYKEAVTPEEQALWKELWEEHASDSSAKFWHIFSCAFENYQNELAKSFGFKLNAEQEGVEQDLQTLSLNNKPKKSKQRKSTESEEDESYLTANDDPEDIDEEQQLLLLGLPTSFASKGVHKSKRQRKPVTESSSSDSEDSDDLSIMEGNDSSALHGVQNGGVMPCSFVLFWVF